ncbi:MAG TPA: hypothetical protein VG713_07610, partial [Pirellulales bacterium]|nr:hypothetical protein [Pirellulales bacterium]
MQGGAASTAFLEAARQVALLASKLGRAFEADKRSGRYDPTAWERIRPAFEAFDEAIGEADRVWRETRPQDCAPVAAQLIRAWELKKKIRAAGTSNDGDFHDYCEFFPDLNSLALDVTRAIDAAEGLHAHEQEATVFDVEPDGADVPASVHEARERTKEFRRLRDEHAAQRRRREPVIAAWDRLTTATIRGNETLAEWQENCALRFAEFGKAMTEAGYSAHVLGLNADDLRARIAIDLLKIALKGDADQVLALLRHYPEPKSVEGTYWPTLFNRDLPLSLVDPVRAEVVWPTMEAAIVIPRAEPAFTCTDRYPTRATGHIGFIDQIADEIHQAADAKRNQLAQCYSNATIRAMVAGPAAKAAEARRRLAELTGIPDTARARVDAIFDHELTITTVEGIDELLRPAVRALREAWDQMQAGTPREDANNESPQFARPPATERIISHNWEVFFDAFRDAVQAVKFYLSDKAKGNNAEWPIEEFKQACKVSAADRSTIERIAGKPAGWLNDLLDDLQRARPLPPAEAGAFLATLNAYEATLYRARTQALADPAAARELSEPPPAPAETGQRKPKKTKRGPKQQYDPKTDQQIADAVREHGGDRAAAARTLGIEVGQIEPA